MKFLANNFALSDAEDNTPRLLNRGGIANLCQKAQESSFWEVIDSFVLLAYASLAASGTLAVITSLSELYFRLRRFVLLVQTKKVISMNYDSSTSNWKPWSEAWLVFVFLIFIFWSNNFSQNSLVAVKPMSLMIVAAEAMGLMIYSYGTSLKWS